MTKQAAMPFTGLLLHRQVNKINFTNSYLNNSFGRLGKFRKFIRKKRIGLLGKFIGKIRKVKGET